jgi:monomeric sarcosine oxidase
VTASVDVAVVGAGVMGAATAWQLAAAGRRVVLLEQFALGHRRGSSHGTSRIFRFSYRTPAWVVMAQEALPRWRDLEVAAGEPLLRLTGGLDLGSEATANAAALEACGAAHAWLEPAEVSRRFPAVAVDDVALFSPDAGIVLGDRALAALLRLAVASGAEVRERVAVTRLAQDGAAVTADTSAGEVRADVVVIAAGAWAPALLATAGITLRAVPTRQTVVYFHVAGDIPSLVEWATPPRYALAAPGVGVKAGEHHVGPVTDPATAAAPDREAVARVAGWVAERFPAADPEPVAAETCLYTTTPDEGFVLERHGRVVVASPCSGHGFKFAPLIGERVAALATA